LQIAAARAYTAGDVDGFDFSIGLGDTNVPWSFPVFDAFGNPFDPAGGDVALHVRIDDDSAAAYDIAGTTFPQAVGPDWVGRVMQGADFATGGVFLVQAIIVIPPPPPDTPPDTRVTYPSNRKMRVLVEAPT
jgi:hypothetical protein